MADESRLTPELHSKLCKKVAQLTKVIYHLNTRNEDSEGRLQELQADYEAEVQSLQADATAKIAAAMDGKQAAAALAEKAAAVEKSFAAEKKKSLEQLESYRAKLKVRQLPGAAHCQGASHKRPRPDLAAAHVGSRRSRRRRRRRPAR